MKNNDVINELGTNFIEYAVAVNTDRAIPNANDGLKPVAKRIIYGAYDNGFKSEKPHVKCANVVGNVMADLHPHGDSSIYGALVRLSQPWVMRYPLIDFHGSNGNIDGDGPAAYRYTEARLSKLVEEGMLAGIKKRVVDFKPNYSETKEEPIELPSLFPNLLCNPNSGIGVAIASSWAPHNLREVADAIYAVMDGKEPMLPGPDFPTGGIVINKDDIPAIMRNGHGSVKLRGKYIVENNKIVFTEIPYGTSTEVLMKEIGDLCESEELTGIEDIRNEGNKKGYRLVIECAKNAPISTIIKKLFAKTNLQISFSYNQVALVDKVPTELNLKNCIDIYIKHNTNTIIRETNFDIEKINGRLEIITGLLKALEDIDKIIALIKASTNSANAKTNLIKEYKFSEIQADAIVNMKLGKLASLEKVEINKEKEELLNSLETLKAILSNPLAELCKRLKQFVAKYGDERRTQLIQINDNPEDKEVVNVEPEKCVVVLTEAGNVRRVASSSFKTQHRNGKGVKSPDDVVQAAIRTNTIDQLLVFTNKGNMYRLLVDNIPTSIKAVPIKSLIEMGQDEESRTIYSIYRENKPKYVLFVTKKGIAKKTLLDEYVGTRKKNGIAAIKIKEDDALAKVILLNEEPLIILTKKGQSLYLKSTDFSATGRITVGVKGITLGEDDEVVEVLPVRDSTDCIAVFNSMGCGKRVELSEMNIQSRGGKGVILYKDGITAAALVSEKDNLLILGDKSSICIPVSEISKQNRMAIGTMIIKGSKIVEVTKYD